MPVDAVGEMSEVIDRVRTILVGAQVVIDQCDLDGIDPEDAVLFHSWRPDFEGSVPEQTARTYPQLIVEIPEFRYLEHSIECMQPQCVIGVHVADRFRHDNHRDNALEFTNFYGGVLEALGKTYLAEGGLVLRTITQTAKPTPVSRNMQTDTNAYWFAEFQLAIGADFTSA